MKIALGNKVQDGPWGGGNQFLAALQHCLEEAGHRVFHSLTEPDLDLILLTEPRKQLKSCAFNHLDIGNYLREVNPGALVVHRVNECDERKGTEGVNALLARANGVADHTVFVSAWLRGLHSGSFPANGQSSVILNGSDPKVFHGEGQAPWDGREPMKLVTHHFGNNWQKGFDLYRELDERLGDPAFAGRYAFTYVGKLPEGFEFKRARYVGPLAAEALRRELASHHVYVTASRFEPGANHQNEGALCGLPLLFLRHASMPEYAEAYGVGFEDLAGFPRALEEMAQGYPALREKIRSYPHVIGRAAREYAELFGRLAADRRGILERRKAGKAARFRSKVPAWVGPLADGLPAFLERLRHPGMPGAYRLVEEGTRRGSERIALGFTCFALKTYYTLGLWDSLPEGARSGMLDRIRSYQALWHAEAGWPGRGAFADREAMAAACRDCREVRRWSARRWLPGQQPDEYQQFVLGETKQALASLFQVGEKPTRPFLGFPQDPPRMRHWLRSYDWSKPWAAGGQAACLALFAATQLEGEARARAVETMAKFYRSLLHKETGAYFQGGVPEYGECVNGAMKVLTGLDWLGEPVHAPEKLIDFTLSGRPPSTGCHLVDAVYVLYRCARESDHRRADVEAYAAEMLEWIRPHVREGGGLSYFEDSCRRYYYRAPVAKKICLGDLHGTSLLIWAIAMCLELLDANAGNWKIMRP
jgi:hypothetical protein